MDDDARVTTTIVVLLIAFCAVLLAKWLAVVALAGLLLVAVLRFALRRLVRSVRARRLRADAPTEVPAGRPFASWTDTADQPVPGPVTGPHRVVVPMPDCSWCGLVGGHRDFHGRPVRPRHAHAMPAPARHAS